MCVFGLLFVFFSTALSSVVFDFLLGILLALVDFVFSSLFSSRRCLSLFLLFALAYICFCSSPESSSSSLVFLRHNFFSLIK